MEFRRKVGVKDAVYIFQMSSSGVFVKLVWFWIWPVEVSTSGCRPKEVKVLARNKHAPLAHQKS